MNRFFSKLNLQDIKINPEGNRFPPDADEHEEEATPVVETAVEQPREALNEESVEQVQDQMAEVPVDVHIETLSEEPSLYTANGNGNGHAAHIEVLETVEVAAPVATNGHSHESVAEAVAYYGGDASMVAVDGEVLKVSARSRPSAVAGAIAGVVREAGRAEVQAIGAGATNQAVKAVAIARDYLSETGIDAVCVPAFIDVTIDNEDRTAIRLVVEPR
jgi:stage V sporulation protein S